MTKKRLLLLALGLAAPARAQFPEMCLPSCASIAPDAPLPQTAVRPRSLLGQIGNDFTHLVRPETLAILTAGAGLSMLSTPEDRPVARALLASPMADTAFDSGEVIGSAAVQVGGAFASYAVGKLARKPTVEALGRDLVRAQVLSQTMTQALKLSARRMRPDGSSRTSFPSGHTSGAFATATVLQQHYGWKAGVPGYALAAYVGVSRIQENRHYLSDVLFGAAIGVLAGRTVNLGNERFAIEPYASPLGPGISLRLSPGSEPSGSASH